jgi:hypothetical protein
VGRTLVCEGHAIGLLALRVTLKQLSGTAPIEHDGARDMAESLALCARLDRVTELTVTFALRMEEGYARIAELMATRLQNWAETGVPIEMTAAPGKWTLLSSPPDVVPVPRGAGEDGHAATPISLQPRAVPSTR